MSKRYAVAVFKCGTGENLLFIFDAETPLAAKVKALQSAGWEVTEETFGDSFIEDSVSNAIEIGE